MAKRPMSPMPEDVAALLDERGLRDEYDAQPYDQRDDHIGWICRAVRGETEQKPTRGATGSTEAGSP